MSKYYLVLLLYLICLVIPVTADNKEHIGYYRYPALHGKNIVFTAEGDLWCISIDGGLARRLTTHTNTELNAAISPDGKTVAFTGQYEGLSEIYVMPIEGGVPERLTFSGQASIVTGWTPDGKIIYSTQKYSTLPETQLIVLNPKDLSEANIPLSQASDGSFNPSGKTLFFTRLPFQGSYTKRYQGGTAQNLWKYELGSEEAIPLTKDYTGTSKNPMWWNNRVYFVSDRDGTMNLWSMKEDGSDQKQHTKHKGFDVSTPSLNDGRIAYQLIGDIYIYDINSNADNKINIMLSSDFEQVREKWIKKPMDYLTSAHISPNGDRVVLTSRGNVFIAPAEEGRFIRITKKEGIRSRSGRFFPDGKSIYFISDESGEQEFYKYSANGLGKSEQLTNDSKVTRFDGLSSPDGKWMVFSDKDYHLWLFNIEKNKNTLVSKSDHNMYNRFSWSPDSKYFLFTETSDNTYQCIMICDIETQKSRQLTSERVSSDDAIFSPDGKWIYFLSDRFFQSSVFSPWGQRQPEPYFEKTTKLYAIALTGKEKFPFVPPDELQAESKENSPKDKTDKEKKEKSGVVVSIDFEGIQNRIYEVPIPAGNYLNLSMNEKNIFLMEREGGGSFKSKLQALDIKDKDIQLKTVIDELNSYELSLDGKKMLIRKSEDIFVIEASISAPAKIMEKKVNLSNWKFSLDPRQEWRQMFYDAWRMERDYFYDRNLHGVDYDGLYKRHSPYVERISDRYELNDLLGHLVGELSALHTFIRGGDLRRTQDDISAASLGARLKRDEQKGGYVIEYIYKTDPDYPERLSPLAKPNINIKEGDIITAINGIPTLGISDIYMLLKNMVNQQVLLETKSSRTGALINTIIKPISTVSDFELRYDDWEYTRRLKVEETGKNEIGYVHLRAMGGNNYTEWVKNFYPVFHKKGLIIDVRHNRGGNIDSWILEKLMRKAWFFWKDRAGKPFWNMQYAFRGHLVVLCNEFTASDGEAFSEGFRQLGLGKIIGTRTWGGEIWLSSSNVLVDRGIASAAEMGVYGLDGKWLIEGHGVDPDIIIDNLPHATYMGKDAQLEAAIKYLEEKIKKEPVEVPPPPKYPDKSLK